MTHSLFTITPYLRQLTVVALSVVLLAGCSTRQVSDTLSGATAQRLVTLSLNNFIEDLAEQPEVAALAGRSIHLGVHFLKDHQLLDYATHLISAQLQIIHEMEITDPDMPADFDVDIFFNSMGTDSDDFGLSIPTLGVATTPDGTINILALDMYHGITEGYAIVKADDGKIEKTERILARIRRDNVSTPVFNFPLNQVD
ncbi:MAG: hypothetical protein AB8B63_22870 [Granulosicoccus sp.]